ncbi:MAG: 6-phosphofructokinase [Clostridia bacterium]|nr:6-phosphofructokinase [Clostridia bacterium]
MTNNRLKGNAIIGQSGGPTAAINATLAGVIRGARACPDIDRIFGAVNGIEGILNETITELGTQFRGEDDLEALAYTPAAALGSCRKKLPAYAADDPTYRKLFSIFAKYNIRYFFYIGGNDSMDTVAKLSHYAQMQDYDIRVMGVPKTIDNDVCGTDHTPGYGSAAKYIAATMQEIIRDCAVYTVPAVTIVEIMGRDAGWLTCAAALPRRYCGVSPDYIYLPERPFDYTSFFYDVEAALKRHPNVVIAVSEGIRHADGHYVGEGSQSGMVDIFGHAYLSGTGRSLEMAIKQQFGTKVRSIELNIMQRCASHLASKTDIAESVRVGMAAVEAAVRGATAQMMAFTRIPGDTYAVDICGIDIASAANHVRCVPDAFINEAGNNVTDACVDYILPLCEGEIAPRYEHGLPVHFVIDKTPVVL